MTLTAAHHLQATWRQRVEQAPDSGLFNSLIDSYKVKLFATTTQDWIATFAIEV
jgi:hypothetical protein